MIFIFHSYSISKCFWISFDFIGHTFGHQWPYRIIQWHIATNKHLFLQSFGKLLGHLLWIASRLSAENGSANSVCGRQSHCHFVERLIFGGANVNEHRLVHLEHSKIVFHIGYIGTEQMIRPFARHSAHTSCRRFDWWHLAANYSNRSTQSETKSKNIQNSPAKLCDLRDKAKMKLFVYRRTMAGWKI